MHRSDDIKIPSSYPPTTAGNSGINQSVLIVQGAATGSDRGALAFVRRKQSLARTYKSQKSR